MTRHIFTTQTTTRDDLLMVTVHASSELDELRRLTDGLVLPGQHWLRMRKETTPVNS